MLDERAKRAARTRLRRIAGQVAGIERMVEEGRYCVDILLQIAAVQSALGGVGKVVLGRHVESCVAQAMASGDSDERKRKTAELLEVFSRYARLAPR